MPIGWFNVCFCYSSHKCNYRWQISFFGYQRSSSNSMEIPSAGEQTCWITEVFIFTNPERSLSFVCSGKKKTATKYQFNIRFQILKSNLWGEKERKKKEQ